MQRLRIALACVVALATSCSLVTSLDGLSGGATTGDGGTDGNVTGIDAPSDAPATKMDASLTDAPSTKPRKWRQLMVSGPPALHSARMVFDEARGKAVLVGGSGSVTNDGTWEWDGTAWSQAMITTRPSSRGSPGLAYDSARHLTMLFAGSNGTPDPWEWDGSAMWKSSGTSASTPDIRFSAVMTYDRKRSVLVVYGGLNTAAMSSDEGGTWEWSPTSGFVNRKPSPSPPPRHANVLVYDEARARVVAFAGSDGSLRNDLWEWDGTTWFEVTPPISPASRRGACAAYDSVRKVTVIFGGRPGGMASALADTWEWDGTAWTPGASGPSGRSSCAMAFDRARNQIVMFGGSPSRVGMNPPQVVDDTWVYE
ncbi:MAG: peptidase in kexin sedolisin [Myxococcaceae bacterium]|nr:peptidase in kexin sedolisin [Myxococcaceae bacterium]